VTPPRLSNDCHAWRPQTSNFVVDEWLSKFIIGPYGRSAWIYLVKFQRTYILTGLTIETDAPQEPPRLRLTSKGVTRYISTSDDFGRLVCHFMHASSSFSIIYLPDTQSRQNPVFLVCEPGNNRYHYGEHRKAFKRLLYVSSPTNKGTCS